MKHRTRRIPLLLCLAGALSCSLAKAPTPVPEPPAVRPLTLRSIEVRLAQLQTGLNAAERRATAAAILEEAAYNGLDVDLILAVMHTESAFHNFARSNVGALGLMQVMPATGAMIARQEGLEWAGPETLFDPVANVRIGCRYLAFLRERYRKIDAALAAYNWGPGAIDRRLSQGHGLPRKYPEAVLARLETQSPPAPAR
jgi:soluble lytic murein transglycosylase-like protein